MSAMVEVVLKGIPASKGVAAGPVFVVDDRPGTRSDVTIDYEAAADSVARRLEAVAAELPPSQTKGAAVLCAQAAMARDPALGRAVHDLEAAGRGLVESIADATETYAGRLAGLPDAYMRERAADVREVGRLLLAEVTGASATRLAALDKPSIVIARELSPADTLSVPSGLLLGIVTEEGGPTSHAAIVARELGIPAVVGAHGAIAAAYGRAGAEIDGSAGEVTFRDRSERRATAGEGTVRLDVSAAPVALMANVGSLGAARAAARRGAAGVGLFRTEFLFMSEHGPMSEDEQFSVYEAACAAMSPHPVVIRTLDAGADKPLAYLPAVQEANPQLGRRGVRLWLAHEELWRPQIRALLRAGQVHSNLQVMVPMVAARSEMALARRRFEELASELGAAVPAVGMMVEVPAVAAAIRVFDGVADFVSLGTNDLTQYTVAADRSLDWDMDLGELNPGVLQLIATVVADATRMRIPVGVCGEMASRPIGAVFLVGVGASSLSMTADALDEVLQATSRLGRARCARAAQAALAADDGRAASAALQSVLAEA